MIKRRQGRMSIVSLGIITFVMGSVGICMMLQLPHKDDVANSNADSEKRMSPEHTAVVGPVAQAYFDAVNNRNLDATVQAFTADAEIIDVSRSIKGHSAIRKWADNEVIGGTYKIISTMSYGAGQDILVEFTPPGASSGFRASYKFEIGSGKIQHANLQYAD